MRTLFERTEVGDSFETAGRTVTEADVVNFAGVSGDFNHHHVDADRMADTDYGGRIAHGAFVFAAATGLLWQSRSPADREDVVAFYGVDDLRFPAPTRIGDTISAVFEVIKKDPRETPDASGVISYDVTGRRSDGTTVLSCELLTLVR
ncbi:monoamine oxidase [Halobacteriales archaeon QS_1_68_17]|nr:MAG: monoamine oxidase [Halobacteriales archaeon QS_1_68_17]